MKIRKLGIGKAPLLWAVGILLCGLAACAERPGAGPVAPDQEVRVPKRIAIVPFREVYPEEVSGRSARCPICGAVFSVEPMTAGSASVVEAEFVRRLEKSGRFDLVPSDRVQAVYQRAEAASFKQTPRQILKAVGEDLSADGIVAGYVYRFRERQGYPYAAERPASVAFEMHLIRSPDGVSVWRGIFDHTQTSLMENVLRVAAFYRGRGRWLTAEELTGEGMDVVLKTFPGLD